jgi:predicted DNA-binding transcriptional regulator YafY
MAQTKNALIRQRVLDRCLRSPKQYSLIDMMEKCSVALEQAGYKSVTSKNTILEDLHAIERDFPGAKIAIHKSGRYVYYEYEDKSFSIYNIPLDDDGMAKLAQTISILSKFEGLPNFDWVDDMIEHFKSSLNIPSTKESVVAFDENFYLRNRDYFSRLFSAIVSEQALVITYEPFGKDVIKYVFHPYFLKQFNNRWFLFGCVDGKNNLSNFPFDRIKSIDNADVQYKPNTTFDFNELFEDVVGVSHITDAPESIQIAIDPRAYDYIESKPIVPSQKVIHRSENSITIEISTVINHELIQLLLSYGSGVTVLNPQKLVTAIKEELSLSLQKYQSVQINCTDSV